MGLLFVTHSATSKTAEGIVWRPSRAVHIPPVQGGPPLPAAAEKTFPKKVGVPSHSHGESRPQGKGAAKDPNQNA